MQLAEQIIHQASMRVLNEQQAAAAAALEGGRLELVWQDFSAARKAHTPAAFKDVQASKADAAKRSTWADIGGLHQVRRVLKETFEWPSKYPALFASCPLKLRRGVLLYGPPGCGKTFLANAVANECGINFVSVKGPEILNKYIGQSEQAVRDLFARAAAAKPCIIFFDEFDAIAPKRYGDRLCGNPMAACAHSVSLCAHTHTQRPR